jgi:hypothetical protein
VRDWKGVSHVKFTGSELGVVRHVTALVSELTANLINAIDAANDELLEEQLGSNAHAQVELQIVVKSFKRPCSGTSCLHVHHWSLDLQKAAGVKVAPDIVDNHAATVENSGDVGVADEIKVTLPVANFRIFQAGTCAWKHVPAFGRGEGSGGGKRVSQDSST